MRTVSATLAALALPFSGPAQNSKSADTGTNISKIAAAEAYKHYNESIVVTGKIVEVTFRPTVVFLSLEKAFPKSPLTAVVFSRATNHFGDLSKLKGKDVEVRGKIIKYRWMPEIVLDKTNQLAVVAPKAEAKK